MKQVRKVVMLPTEKSTNLYLYNKELVLLAAVAHEPGTYNGSNQHLYILSDDADFPEGDYYWNGILKVIKQLGRRSWLKDASPEAKQRIIASTDKSITPNSWIPDSFIPVYAKAYNEGKPITEVSLEYQEYYDDDKYKVHELKTRPDGSVIISQSKTYTEDDMRRMYEAGRNFQISASPTFKEMLEHLNGDGRMD